MESLKQNTGTKRPKLVSTIHGLYSMNFLQCGNVKTRNIITVSNSAHSYLVNNYQNTESKNIKLIYRGVDKTNIFMAITTK